MAFVKRGWRGGPLSWLYSQIVHRYYADDLWLDLRLAAKKESVEYALQHMQEAQILADRWALMKFALSRAPADGSLLEFGVYRGRSINFLAGCTTRTVHGFDSFEGLPVDWRGMMEQKGSFGAGGRAPKVAPNVQLHPGWFKDTLGEFLRGNNEPASFMHIDCDVYEATRDVFDAFRDRIVRGTIIVFDEYFNFPGWRHHEYKAFQEFIAASGRSYRYFGLSAQKGHVAVEML